MDAVDFIRVLSFCGKGQMEINLSEGLFCTGKAGKRDSSGTGCLEAMLIKLKLDDLVCFCRYLTELEGDSSLNLFVFHRLFVDEVKARFTFLFSSGKKRTLS